MTADFKATAQPPRRRAISAILRWFLARWRAVLLTLVAVFTIGLATGYFYFMYRPELQVDNAVAREVIKAASDGAVALLSYSPDTLNRDFSNAKSRLTDNYLAYYRQFAEQVVTPSAQRGRVTTSATVIKAAVSDLHPDSAVVLVFVKQKTSSKAKPEPVVTSSSLQVTLKKVNGSWLIENFDAL